MHHFWACPVPQPVVDQLSITISRPISRAEVWLAQTPEGVEKCVWDVVVLAAITAMEQGRRFMAAGRGPARGPGAIFVGTSHHPRGGWLAPLRAKALVFGRLVYTRLPSVHQYVAPVCGTILLYRWPHVPACQSDQGVCDSAFE
jgi:hypothetical protein